MYLKLSHMNVIRCRLNKIMVNIFRWTVVRRPNELQPKNPLELVLRSRFALTTKDFVKSLSSKSEPNC